MSGTDQAQHGTKRDGFSLVSVPKQLIDVWISLDDLPRVPVEEHCNIRIRVTQAQGRKHGKREYNVAEAVGADKQNSVYVVGDRWHTMRQQFLAPDSVCYRMNIPQELLNSNPPSVRVSGNEGAAVVQIAAVRGAHLI